MPGKWMDGVLSPNGNLYCQPWSEARRWNQQPPLAAVGRRWPPRCANRILQINTNTGEVDLIGGCLNFICFQMFTLMFIDLWTFYREIIFCWYCPFGVHTDKPLFWNSKRPVDLRKLRRLPGPDLGWMPDKYRAAVVATDGVSRPMFSASKKTFEDGFCRGRPYTVHHFQRIPQLWFRGHQFWKKLRRTDWQRLYIKSSCKASRVLRVDLTSGDISLIGYLLR